MISELLQEEFGKLESLLEHPLLTVEAKAIASGVNPGRIFVDAVDHPRSALVYSPGMEGFYLAGDPENELFVDALDRFIEQEVGEWELEWVEISGCSPDWNRAIERAFAERELERSRQEVYRLPEGFAAGWEMAPFVRPLDASIFIAPLEGIDFARRKIDQFWSSLDDYLDAGFGFCAVIDERVVSVCFAAYRAGQVRAVDIETAKEFRQRGLGLAVARAFVDRCRAEGLVPHWDCMQTNEPSALLAQKVGFVRQLEYTLYEFPLEEGEGEEEDDDE